MFEKEAEERIKEKYGFQSFITREQGKELYQDGAEFGFQKGIKAKVNTTTISDCPIKDEWHYVKDGDLPKEEDLEMQVLCFTTDGYRLLSLFSDPEPIFNGYGVIAWKELERLPNLRAEEMEAH